MLHHPFVCHQFLTHLTLFSPSAVSAVPECLLLSLMSKLSLWISLHVHIRSSRSGWSLLSVVVLVLCVVVGLIGVAGMGQYGVVVLFLY